LLIYFQQICGIHRILPSERAFIALGAVITVTLPVIVFAQKLKIHHLFYNRMNKINSRNKDEL
jgi:hypothetical protein